MDWIFSHPDEVDQAEMDQQPSATEPEYLDGEGSVFSVVLYVI